LGFPLILAGGLHPGNVSQALTVAQPDAIDLSSGVEQSPGVKDPEKIKELMMRVR
jgi:phosphoribosylanthranilate isomerase